jgi:ABC-type nitrate/sulfonate/bicarbonate transport system permease component
MNAIRVPVGVGRDVGTGPETSPTPAAAGRGSGRRPLVRLLRTAGIVVLVCAVVTVAVQAGLSLAHVAPFVVPPPSAVVRELAADPGLYLHDTLVTLAEAAAGLALAVVFALAFAAAALHSRLLDRVLTPLVVVTQTVPVIALAPLLVLWLGYGALPRVVVCALIAFFPLAVTSLQGLRATDPQLLLLLRSLDASAWFVFWRVRVPGAAPYFAAGLRTGATLSLVGAVVAEWTGSDAGLGYLVLSANARLATAQAFAAILLITLLGLAAYAGVAALERRVCWWTSSASPVSASRKGPV